MRDRETEDPGAGPGCETESTGPGRARLQTLQGVVGEAAGPALLCRGASQHVLLQAHIQVVHGAGKAC